MKFTDSAINAILETMRKRGLNPKEFVFDVSLRENGSVGIGFTKDRAGKTSKYGDLIVMIGHGIDMNGVVVDFGEVNGRRGIVFVTEEQFNLAEEQYVDQIDGKSS